MELCVVLYHIIRLFLGNNNAHDTKLLTQSRYITNKIAIIKSMETKPCFFKKWWSTVFLVMDGSILNIWELNTNWRLIKRYSNCDHCK